MKKILNIVGIACLFVLYACSHDQIEVGQQAASTTLGVTVSLDRMTGESAMRASVAPEQGEEVVNSLYLYFFEANESRAGLFVDYIKVTGPLAMHSKYTLQTTGTAINVSDAYHVIAVANLDDNQYIAGDAVAWSTQWANKTEEYFRNHALTEVSGATGESDNSKAIDNDKILMNGTAVKKAMDGDISVVLTRNMARFDVINSVNDEYDLMSASIWNAYSRSSVTGDAVLDYSSQHDARTGRFYGVDNSGNTVGTIVGDIRGGLYAFENKVVSPVADDIYTTCLIVGLKNRTTGNVGYYRVNIHPDESPQNLKRNNVYKVTITGVTGDGADTESEAYAGAKNELIFVINYWDLDDNGLIVSDQNSILAVPVKTVRIGAEGGDFSFTVTTFSSLASPDPLVIKSQTYDPLTGKISASLSGSNLVIRAQDLPPGEGNRTGIITLSFAGLEAHVNVLQSESVDTYLNVTLEDTWESKLGSIAGISSEYVYVNASGAWTAELFGEGFSFDSNTGAAPVTTLTSASVNNKFHVYTHTQNSGLNERKAFILISLDSDPINYVASVPVYQKIVGRISVNPDAETIVFDGSKAITSHPDNAFTVASVSGMISSYSLAGVNPDKFTVTLPTGNASVTMTVAANESNTSGVPYTAVLRIADSSGAERHINLRQVSVGLALSPSNFGTIPTAGGQTDLITVSTGDASLRFTATISTVTPSTGKTLINHDAYFVDEYNNEIDLSTARSTATKFRVKFPIVYFPNREMDITATVTVNIEGSNLTKTVAINQNALRSKGVKIQNARYSGTNAPWGNLNSSYIRAYGDALKNRGYSWTNGSSSSSVTSVIPAGTTYTHFASSGVNATYNWSVLQNFRRNTDGVLLVSAQSNTVTAVNDADSPLAGYDISYGGGQTGNYAVKLSLNVENTRIGKFLTTHGVNPIASPTAVSGFYIDGYHTSAARLPSTAVKILQKSNGRAILSIDPANKVVYLGESQVFFNVNNVPAGSLKESFMLNFIEYMINAAKYGRHFTDLLREDLANDVPAMWDDAWGVNKWRRR